MIPNGFAAFFLAVIILACIASIAALAVSIYALIIVKAMEKSTHSVQYVPLEPKWAMSEKEIEEINKVEASKHKVFEDAEVY